MLLPNPLHANLQGYPFYLRRRTDEAFQKTLIKVLRRDRAICQYCGFQSKRFQQVVNRDYDYKNNVLENLVTACPLCVKVHFLGTQDSGKIVCLPEYSQAELMNLTRILFCLMDTQGSQVDMAKSLYRSLRQRSQKVEDVFGKGMSDAMTFGQCLEDLSSRAIKKSGDVISQLRLIPNRQSLDKPVAYWAEIILPQFQAEQHR